MQWLTGVFLAFAAQGQPGVPAIDEIEQQVGSYRRLIEGARVEWEQETYGFADGDRSLARGRTSTIWSDGKRHRIDVRLRYSADVPFHREVYCRDCEVEGSHVHWSDRDLGGGERIVVGFEDSSRGGTATSFYLIDPRLLGMYPDSSPNLYDKHLESFLGRQDREDVSVEKADWQGRECWLLKYRILQGVGIDARVWVVPEWGPSVVRMEAEWKVPHGHFMDSIECQYRQYEPSMIWYPESCTYRRTKDGEPVEEETVKVLSVSLNEPLDPIAFKLAGMDIPPGTVVTGYPGTEVGTYAWDGKEVVRVDAEPELTPFSDEELAEGAWRRRILLLANSVVLALIAGFCLWMYLRKRRAREG
jgi:hypothetical protein